MIDRDNLLYDLKQRLGWLGSVIRELVVEFQRELLGLALLVLGLVTLVSLLFPASAPLTEWWSHNALRLLGWGAYLAVVLVSLVGGILVAMRRTDRWRLTWQQVAGWEIVYFALLGIVHLLTPGESPGAIAEAGRGGGYVGWGIASAFSSVLGFGLTLLLLIVFILAGVYLALHLATDDLRQIAIFLRDQGLILWERMQPDRDFTESEAPSPRPDAPLVVEASELGISEPRTVKKKDKPSRLPKIRKSVTGSSLERDPSLPPFDLLRPDSAKIRESSDANLKAEIIVETLAGFGIPARVVDINRGPTVTQFGIEPGFLKRKDKEGREVLRKVRVSKIHALTNDLALALAASPIRIEAPVPGRPYVGIEVPNDKTSLVSLRGVMESEEFKTIGSPLSIALGRDVSGAAVAADLAAMPHLLIAGATGSGKSVCINTIVSGLLMQNRPETLRLLMVDPKRVELVGYNGVPHLVAPVVVDLNEVVGALQWVVREMYSRYELFASMGARYLESYNRKAARRGETQLPYLVVVIDELADLMMVAPVEIEQAICRIAQMARATGIHLVIATQRPSVDVVTGLIKANFPARISFAVTSQIDSRVILDTAGAEKLLGRGDMLYMSPDSSKLARLQGCYVSDKEIQAIVRHWQKTSMAEVADQPEPEAGLAEEPDAANPWEVDEGEGGGDDMFGDAVDLLEGKETISTSYLQRSLRIGYPRAARLMDMLEEHGYVGPNLGGGKSRDVLIGASDPD